MSLRLRAPLSGTIVSMSDVPDPVFAQAVVGPGIAIEPDVEATKAYAPLDGLIAKIHPHAFALQTADGSGLLVHLGLNTVEMNGEGFTLHAKDGDEVKDGQLLIEWSPDAVRASGRSAIVPIVAMQADANALTFLVEPGAHVNTGDDLFEWA